MEHGTDQTTTREDLHRRIRAEEVGTWICMCRYCRRGFAKKRRGRKNRGTK